MFGWGSHLIKWNLTCGGGYVVEKIAVNRTWASLPVTVPEILKMCAAGCITVNTPVALKEPCFITSLHLTRICRQAGCHFRQHNKSPTLKLETGDWKCWTTLAERKYIQCFTFSQPSTLSSLLLFTLNIMFISHSVMFCTRNSKGQWTVIPVGTLIIKILVVITCLALDTNSTWFVADINRVCLSLLSHPRMVKLWCLPVISSLLV